MMNLVETLNLWSPAIESVQGGKVAARKLESIESASNRHRRHVLCRPQSLSAGAPSWRYVTGRHAK